MTFFSVYRNLLMSTCWIHQATNMWVWLHPVMVMITEPALEPRRTNLMLTAKWS